MPNGSTYDSGIRPRLLINWGSFVAEGISTAWQGPFTDATINAYTRWMQVAGVDMRPQFWGYTNATASAAGELLVLMDPAFGGGPSWRLASTFWSPGGNSANLILHRRASANMSPWNFVPWNASPGEFDMQAILMHEMGHAFGLNHSGVATETMWGDYSYHNGRYGPFEGDVARFKAMNGDFTQNRLRELRSSDGGVTWSGIVNELTDFNHYHARTTLAPGVCGMPNFGLYNVGWSHPNRIPTHIRTDGQRLLARAWNYYGGERSVHGPAYAADDRGTILWAWVGNDDEATLRLARSTGGLSWVALSPPAGAHAGGTPALAWARVGGVSTWILAWSHFDRNDQVNTGFARFSLSADEGVTWSSPAFINQATKALSGVAAALSPAGEIVIAFAFANHLGAGALNEIVTLHCNLQGGRVQVATTRMTGEYTRIQPALTYDAGRARFIMAWREQNFGTTLATMVCPAGGGPWSGKVQLLDRPSNVSASLGSLPDYSECVLWYAYEGNP